MINIPHTARSGMSTSGIFTTHVTCFMEHGRLIANDDSQNKVDYSLLNDKKNNKNDKKAEHSTW